MPLQPGTTLGPSVAAKIGEGGLGEVSRARIPSSTETSPSKSSPNPVRKTPTGK